MTNLPIKKFALAFFFVGLIIIVALVYITMFTAKERHAWFVRTNEDKITLGITVSVVTDILSEPDTTYLSFEWGPQEARPVKVLEYYRGFASADNLRILIKGDTVVGVSSNR